MLRATPRQISANNASITGFHHQQQQQHNASPAMRRKRKETECMLKLDRVLGLTSSKPMALSVNSGHDLVAYAAGCVVVLYNHKLDKQVALLCSSTLKKPSSESHASSSSGSGPSSLLSGGAGSNNNSAHGLSSVGHKGIASLGSSPRTTLSSQWMSNPLASVNVNPLAGLMPLALSDPSVASSFGLSNPSSNKNIKPKPISCLSFSPDGQFLAIGETGHQPRILIWEVATQLLVAELQGHKFGVQAVQFSPNSKHLVSLGFQHDGYIHVWNWRTGLQIASNKVTTKVNALAFSKDGSYFVTAGLRHVKFWYLSAGSSKRSGTSTAHNIQVIDGRAGILGELRDSNYVDAVCSHDGHFTYAITSNGVLSQFSENRVLEKWVDLQVRGAYSVNLTEDGSVVCACTDGVIRLFQSESLKYIATLPKPEPIATFLRSVNPDEADVPPEAVHADVLASQYDPSSDSLICIYSDRSLSVWQMRDNGGAELSRSHLAHSDCVWGVEILPECIATDEARHFPPHTFATYSADGSIRFWHLDDGRSLHSSISDLSVDAVTIQDIDSTSTKSEVVKVLYVDENCASWIRPPDNQDGAETGFNTVPGEFGIRTVKFSPDGRLLASGDKGGNLRVHDLSTFGLLTYQEAHENEILAIDFTEPQAPNSPYLVATAGRDRLLHIFDVRQQYALLQTLDDHSSSITCIKFLADGSRMMSCGADKSVVFRSSHQTDDGLSFAPYHQAPGRATFHDMNLHGPTNTLAVVAGDRRFNIFAVETGKSIKSFKAETKGDDLTAGMAEICSMTHISLDPTGTIAAASGSDKSVRIYDLLHGSCLAHMICHAELVTDVKFNSTYDKIISTSADGCILVWKLSRDLCRRIQVRIKDNVTLPSYLEAKAVEAAFPTPPPPKSVGASPKTIKLRRSIDRLASYSGELSGSSRRNSTTSLMSDDFDVRSEGAAGDSRERIETSRQRGRAVTQDPSQLSFTPITSVKTVRPSSSHHSSLSSLQQSGTGSRVRNSVSKSPLNRSRQTSVSQSGTPKAPLRTGHSTEITPPAWNRNVVKDRAPTTSQTSSAKSSRPASPGMRAKKDRWLSTGVRPRASSMTTASVSAVQKFPESKRKEGKTTLRDQRHSLSDHSHMDPMHTAASGGAEDDDDKDTELSDETESGFEDGLGFHPSELTKVTEKLVAIDSSVASRNRVQSEPSPPPPSNLGRSNSVSPTTLPEPSSPTDSIPHVSDDDLTGTEAASEGRDGDDEDADEGDEESVSDTGSDNTEIENEQDLNVSPLRLDSKLSSLRRFGDAASSPILASPGSRSLGSDTALSPLRSTASVFQEGEVLTPSPKGSLRREPTSTSPGGSLGRAASLRPSGAGRSSLSSKFLTAHAATIMMSLVRHRPQDDDALLRASSVEPEDRERDDDCRNEAELLGVGSNSATPRAASRQEGINTADNKDTESQQTSKDRSGDEPQTTVQMELDSVSSSLGEKLNTRSPNHVTARKRKQRSLGSVSLGQGGLLYLTGLSTPPQSGSTENTIGQPVTTSITAAKGDKTPVGTVRMQRPDLENEATQAEKSHEQTLQKKAAELGYLDSPGGTRSACVSSTATARAKIGQLKPEMLPTATTKVEDVKVNLDHNNILASPADVGSPVSTMGDDRGRRLSRIDRGGMAMMAQSLDQALARACERSCSRPPLGTAMSTCSLSSLTSPIFASNSWETVTDQKRALHIGQQDSLLSIVAEAGLTAQEQDDGRDQTHEGAEEQEEYSESLTEAFEKLSFLISYRANQASQLDTRHRAGVTVEDSASLLPCLPLLLQDQQECRRFQEEEKARTRKWMKETRDGLLSLVGQVQGHLWQLENDKSLKD
ncbi:mitogen-activated protein kinase binding protein 1 [Gryganskiella cystojenkinii]|nr:mitogen-activated protein kinase binding protein 1 [Gryganskiella cystojenkinii]